MKMWKPLLCTVLLAHASFSVSAASNDSYPSRPIRLIDGFPPGGGSDYLDRVIGPVLTERLGQNVIVDNRPGAGGNLAAEIAARANPDGYTLFMGISMALASSPSLYPKLGYDPLKDFSHISRVATGTYVLLAHPSVPAKSVAELVALARSKPKSIRYGSAGVATPGHLPVELLQTLTGMELLHVPYKGIGPAIIALTGGEVQLALAAVTAALPMIQAKRLNGLAVTSAKRVGVLPALPTVAESGVPGFDVTASYGVLAPTGTPAAVVKLLNSEIRSVMQIDDVKAKLATQGMEAAATTPDEWLAIIKAETAKWTRVIKDAHITAN